MEKEKLDKDAIKKVVTERIRAGDNYKQTRKFLDKSGIKYTGLKTTFYTWKNEIFPEQATHSALHFIHGKTKFSLSKQHIAHCKPCTTGEKKRKTNLYFQPRKDGTQNGKRKLMTVFSQM
jgi:hypothetical protein